MDSLDVIENVETDIKENNEEDKKTNTRLKILIIILIILLLLGGLFLYFTLKDRDAKPYNSLIEEMNIYTARANNYDPLDTVSEVQDELVKHGFRICALKPANEKYCYGYDIVKKEFVLLNKENGYKLAKGYVTEANENVYVFVSNNEELKKANLDGFSAYLLEEFATKSIEVYRGLDAGEALVESVSYINNGDKAINAILVTNYFNTELKVEYSLGSIRHYGYASKVELKGNNYSEHGIVGILLTNNEVTTFDEGRVITTNNSKCADGKHGLLTLVVDDKEVYVVCDTCGHTIKDGKAYDKPISIGTPEKESKPSKYCHKDHCDEKSYKKSEIGGATLYICTECGFTYRTK